MEDKTNLLIIGAGPFGLGLAAYAAALGIEYKIVGKPMEFWQTNMPEGMFLRSASDWHLDATGKDTIEAFLASQNLTPADVEPLSRTFYLDYTRWFQQQKNIQPIPAYVQELDVVEEPDARFRATLDNGDTIKALNVALAVGFKYFPNVPAELAALLPAGSYEHTVDLVDFAPLKGKRVLLLGGRQSAFEWAALLQEAGVAEINLAYRHASPVFAEADWSWVTPIMDNMVDNPTWFRSLSKAEQDDVSYRLWAEGRLKVEPWLEKRVMTANVKLWPGTKVVAANQEANGASAVMLDNGETLLVDQIILATGYKVNMAQVPFLSKGNVLSRLETRNGFPALDDQFQTNIPGLYVTSMPANQDFGPFFAFTVSVRTSSKIIGRSVAQGSIVAAG